MVLKRKRSASDLFSSPSSSSSTSTFSFNSSPPPHQPFAVDATSPCALAALPAHLPSRTLKRFRDSRPSDAEVHRKFYEWRAHHRRRSSGLAQPATESSCVVSADRTLSLLYSAQQHHAPLVAAAAAESTAQPPAAAPAAPSSPAGQQSLHRFWDIASAPSSSSGSVPPLGVAQQAVAPSSCDDCGAGLAAGPGGDAMDVDGCEDHACGACGKNVCFSCSVSNLGEQKRCLQCAGRRVWIGGIGWASAPVPVC